MFRSTLIVVPFNLPLKVGWDPPSIIGLLTSSLIRQFFAHLSGSRTVMLFVQPCG